MKTLLKPLYVIFILLGIGVGFAYYYFVGCSTGTCPLKSNPWIMMGYGGLIGYLCADLIHWLVNNKKQRKID